MVQIVKSIIDAIVKQDVSKPEKERDVRIAMYTLILLFFLVVMMILIPLSFVVGDHLKVGYIAVFFVVCLIQVLVWKKGNMLFVDIFSFIYAINIIVFLSLGHFEESKFIWLIAFPVYVYTFADIKRGIFYPLFLIICVLLTQAYANLVPNSIITSYDLKFILRFVGAYVMISIGLLSAIWMGTNIRHRLDMFSKDSTATIAELEATREELKRLGNIDSLTALYNKRYLETSGNKFIADGRCSYVVSIFIDIDDFKKYNDGYGHLKGDVVLEKVASKITSVLELYNCFLVRFGGEEILCILKLDNDKSIDFIAADIVSGVSGLNLDHVGSKCGKITCSAGVAYKKWSQDIDIDSLIKESDEAMYFAKSNGKNQYCYSDASINM